MASIVTSMTLTQGVAEHLRSLIHRGEVGPGDRLPPERELAEQLGVARISLREAIKLLVDDGYVQVRRGAKGGTFITELHRPVESWRARMRDQAGTFDDIIDFRIALECHTARLAAAHRTKQDLSALRMAIANLSRTGGRATFRLADSQFHGGLATAAGNIRLANAIYSVRGELFSPHDVLTFVEPIDETLRDHQAIYDAVRDRDADGAAALMTDHIERTRKQLRVIVFGTVSDRRAKNSDDPGRA